MSCPGSTASFAVPTSDHRARPVPITKPDTTFGKAVAQEFQMAKTGMKPRNQRCRICLSGIFNFQFSIVNFPRLLTTAARRRAAATGLLVNDVRFLHADWRGRL